MEKFIIIVAGGSGTRMNSSVPKQFLELRGKPIMMHTIEKFTFSIPEINVIIVLAKNLLDDWKTLCKKHNFTIQNQLIQGGKTRFDSVKNGLVVVPENCIVGIHDAARPLVSKQTIINAFAIALRKGNAAPAIVINESLREVKKNTNKAVDRNNYFIIQTPQCFRSSLIKKAFLQEYTTAFTDDVTVLETIGTKINLIEGNKENIKITTPQDLIIVEALLKTEK